MNFFRFVLLLSLTVSLSHAATDPLYATFVQCLQTNKAPMDIVYSPTNPSFTAVLQAYIKNSRFNTSSTPKPSLIVTPKTYPHVQAAVLCAKASNIQLKTRSGGHDYEGRSYVSDVPFIILDMFNLRTITVDIPKETAFVQVGANLGELYYRISEKSKVHGFPGGVCPTVGVGGHFSGGGYGNMIRKYGLTVDHVIDAEIVDVNGKLLDRKGMGEDLFWAIRGGGGGSFAVIISYTIKLVQVPETVSVFRVAKSSEENAAEVLTKWQSSINTIDNGLFIRVLLQPNAKNVLVSFYSLFLGDANTLMDVMNKNLPELGVNKTDILEMSWINSVLYWANFDNKTSPEILLNRHSDVVRFGKRKSDYVQTPITKDGFEKIFTKLMEARVGFVFNPYGGMMSKIPATETPMAHRAGNLYKIQYSVSWNEDGEAVMNKNLNEAKSLHTFMTPYVSKNPRGAYLNYRDLDIGVNSNGKDSYTEGLVYGTKFFLGNFDRLVRIKTTVDPDNFFRNEQSIPVKKA